MSQTKLIITTIVLIIVTLLSLYSVYKYKEKSQGDKYISIICAVLSLIVALFNAGPQIVQNIQNNNYYIQHSSSSTQEEKLLTEAKSFVDSGDYENAWKILNDSQLEDSDNAKIDMGYMYAHGYGVTQDVNKALEILDQYSSAESRRIKLGLLISRNENGVLNEQVLEEIRNLLSMNDSNVKKYLSSFLNIDLDNSNIDDLTIDPSVFNEYEKVSRDDYDNPPRDTGYERFRFIGAHYPSDSSNRTLPLFTYDMYRLKNIEMIDRFVI